MKIKNKCEITENVITDKLIEKIIGFDVWAEKNKQRFMKKYAPKSYPELFISEQEQIINEDLKN